MKRILQAAFGLLLTVVASHPTWADGEKLKPYILASKTETNLAQAVSDAKSKLAAGGFALAGEYAPYDKTQILVVTNESLKAQAAKSAFGGYGAMIRVSLVVGADGKVQVAYVNPTYMAAAYRMSGNLGDIAAQLASALGQGTQFGSKDGLSEGELRHYHYMFAMPYFDEAVELAEYKTHAEALAAVEKGLGARLSGTSKIYRIDIPGKEESVFGVGFNGASVEGKYKDFQDDAHIMSIIDTVDPKSAAHLPYEMLVSGGKILALHGKFRIAVDFPDLGMGTFMLIGDTPYALELAMTQVARSAK